MAGSGRTVVIGFDARHHSDVFASDTARVLAAAGVRALLFPSTCPTPVLAYAIRAVDADAGVMCTASHNPATDNGYKIYVSDGAQIIPPTDADIATAIEEVARPARWRWRRLTTRPSTRSGPNCSRATSTTWWASSHPGRGTCASSTRRCTASAAP